MSLKFSDPHVLLSQKFHLCKTTCATCSKPGRCKPTSFLAGVNTPPASASVLTIYDVYHKGAYYEVLAPSLSKLIERVQPYFKNVVSTWSDDGYYYAQISLSEASNYAGLVRACLSLTLTDTENGEYPTVDAQLLLEPLDRSGATLVRLEDCFGIPACTTFGFYDLPAHLFFF